MARAKRPSDELYNARRRVRRMAERAERRGDKGEAERLRGIVAGSYASAGKDMASQRATLDAIYTTRHLTRKPTEGTRQAYEALGLTPTQPTPSSTQGASGKTPRKKRASDELYNARRRLRREADALERRAKGMVGAEREAALGYAKYLREQALPTGKLDAEKRGNALDRLQNLRERSYEGVYGKDATLRRNMIFKQQMNAAGTEGADSSISERTKDVFWMATKGLWPKGSQVPRNERYERIIEHFYRDQTTDAREFRAWLESRGIDLTSSFGDLQFIYEYVTEVLNDPQMYEVPEMPYQGVANVVRMAM